jgi:hypothetical protein
VIAAPAAARIARAEVARMASGDDPLFAPWRDAAIGDPVLVHDLLRQPSYWVVPVRVRDRVAGFVRVLLSGRVSATGTLYTDPARIASCPATVTGIEKEEAARRATERIHAASGEVAQEPVYVHDGAPGREAWLIEVVRENRPQRWVFVTPAFVYERPAGQTRDPQRE